MSEYATSSDANLSREIAKIVDRHDKNAAIDNKRSANTKSARGIKFVFFGLTGISEALGRDLDHFRLPVEWTSRTASEGHFELYVTVVTKDPPNRCVRFVSTHRKTIAWCLLTAVVTLWANQLVAGKVYGVCWTETTRCGRIVAETNDARKPWSLFTRAAVMMISGGEGDAPYDKAAKDALDSLKTRAEEFLGAQDVVKAASEKAKATLKAVGEPDRIRLRSNPPHTGRPTVNPNPANENDAPP